MKANVIVEADIGGRRARLSEIAVELALHGRWAEAADLNRRIIEQAPDNVRAHNRLSRALEALGRTAHAREAYSAALAVDAHDRIAARSLGRLAGASRRLPPAATPAARPLDYGRLELPVEEPPELQDEYHESYEEYETEEPERVTAERIELAGELQDEAAFEELEGALGPDLLDDERQQEERDRALAAEEESDL